MRRLTCNQAGKLLCPFSPNDEALCQGDACAAWDWYDADHEVWSVPPEFRPNRLGTHRTCRHGEGPNWLWRVTVCDTARRGYCAAMPAYRGMLDTAPAPAVYHPDADELTPGTTR